MKKILTVIVLVTFLGFQGKSQSYNHVIKTSPIGLAFGNFNATYEHVLNEKSSLLGSLSYIYTLFGEKVNTFGMRGAYRYYFTNKKVDVPSGFYVNPLANIAFGSDEFDTKYGYFGFGFEVGYQFAFDSGFVFDLGIGPVFEFLLGDYEDVDFDTDDSFIIVPRITIAVGYAW